MVNKFTKGLQKNKPGTKTAPQASSKVNPHARPSRKGTKHIGGHFSPKVSAQLRQIARNENSSVQASLGEALDMFFSDRGLPTIAGKQAKKKQKGTR